MSDAAVSSPPQPLPDVDSAGFWAATARGHLALSRCSACQRWQHPPVERCRQCAAPTAFEPVSGTGTLFSYIVMRRASVPGFDDLLPYVVATVELDEEAGLRFVARLEGVGPADVAIGSRVRAEIVPVPGGDYHVPVFRPIDESSEAVTVSSPDVTRQASP